jgi:hypothetical protein
MKSIDSLEEKMQRHSFGSYFAKSSKVSSQVYTLGFTSYKGTAGRLGQPIYNAGKPSKLSFENSLPKNLRYGFVDFKKYNQLLKGESEFFYSKASGHANMKAKWNKIYDGFFYIRDMYPCKAIEPLK